VCSLECATRGIFAALCHAAETGWYSVLLRQEREVLLGCTVLFCFAVPLRWLAFFPARLTTIPAAEPKP